MFRRYPGAAETQGALFSAAADGSDEYQITHPGAGTTDREPDWSSDGTRILFARDTAIGTTHETQTLFTVSPDGTALKPLTPTHPRPNDVRIDGEGVFSPDGKLIVFTHGHGAVDPSTGPPQYSDISVMNADGTNEHQLTHFPADTGQRGGYAWSPDGKQLVYTQSNADTARPPGQHALFIMNANGSAKRRLTPWSLGADGTPDWAKTNLITFRAVKDEESGVGNFYTVHPDGTSLTQVTHFTDTAVSNKIGFSPDGSWITFGKEVANGNVEIFTAKVDGSLIRPMTDTSKDASAPDWGPPA